MLYLDKLYDWRQKNNYEVRSFDKDMPHIYWWTDTVIIVNRASYFNNNAYVIGLRGNFQEIAKLHNSFYKDIEKMAFHSANEAKNYIDNFIKNIDKYKKLEMFI